MTDQEIFTKLFYCVLAASAGGIIQLAWQEIKKMKLPVHGDTDPAFFEPLPIEARKRFMSVYGIVAGVFGAFYFLAMYGYFDPQDFPNTSALSVGAFFVGLMAHKILKAVEKARVENLLKIPGSNSTTNERDSHLKKLLQWLGQMFK